MGMSSINTNISAMTALQSLQQTSKDLLTTQNRISTGLKVATASDNAAYWSIATTMKSDNDALSTVQDALGLGKGTVDVAYNAMNQSITLVGQIKQKLTAAAGPGVDRTKIQAEISQLQDQLKGIADTASFSGENWISVDSSASGYSATKTIVASFARTSDGSVSIGTIKIDTSKSVLFDAATSGAGGILDAQRSSTGAIVTTGGTSVMSINISSLTSSDADQATLNGYITSVDTAFQEMTKSATDLGASQQRINLQTDFVSSLMNTIKTGVSQLVDADMNEESTALRTSRARTSSRSSAANAKKLTGDTRQH
jgi:flagellin